MLTKLKISNFKAWQELDIRLGRVTGLFGTNSSGKSSILQFLLMLKQTKNATDRGLVLDLGGENQLVNLGTFKDMVHKHQDASYIKWTIEWKLNKPLNGFVYFLNNMPEVALDHKRKKVRSSLFFPETNTLETNAMVSFKNKRMKLEFLNYHFGNLLFEINSIENSNSYEPSSYELKFSPHNDKSNNLNKSHNFKNKFYAQRFAHARHTKHIRNFRCISSPIKTHLFPIEAKIYSDYSLYLSTFESEYESMMNGIYHLGPLREYPKREYQWSGTNPFDVGSRGERTVDAILSATMRGEIYKLGTIPKTFQEIIAHWLKELGLIQSFSIKEIADGSNLYRAIVKRDEKSPEAFLTDVGFGVSQVLPALVLLYYVPEGSTILMEQPEIHLHPSVQSNLADVILQVAKHRNIQVIVESHSEHLLRRFQRRIAEEKYPIDELKLYFCDSVQGESKLSDLDIDMFGDIRNWPENFFGDEMAEIAATRTAALKRKIQESSKNGG